MSLPGYVPGMPGIRVDKQSAHRVIFHQGWQIALAGPKVISGATSRDSGNTGNLGVLRSGLLMGKITASGEYAPSVIGVTTGAYTSGGTELTVSAAQAVELVRRVGSSGTGYVVGPPSAAGTVAATALTYSAVNTTTGVITCTSLGVNKIAGSWVCADDGSHTPRTFIPDGFGVNVLDVDGSTSLDVEFAAFPIGGHVRTANVLPGWPSDTSFATWVRDALKANCLFTFDDLL